MIYTFPIFPTWTPCSICSCDFAFGLFLLFCFSQCYGLPATAQQLWGTQCYRYCPLHDRQPVRRYWRHHHYLHHRNHHHHCHHRNQQQWAAMRDTMLTQGNLLLPACGKISPSSSSLWSSLSSSSSSSSSLSSSAAVWGTQCYRLLAGPWWSATGGKILLRFASRPSIELQHTRPTLSFYNYHKSQFVPASVASCVPPCWSKEYGRLFCQSIQSNVTHLSLPSKYIDRAATFNVSSSFLFPPPPVGTPPPPHSSLHCASSLPNQQPLKLVTTRLKVDNCSGFVSLLHQAVPIRPKPLLSYSHPIFYPLISLKPFPPWISSSVNTPTLCRCFYFSYICFLLFSRYFCTSRYVF